MIRRNRRQKLKSLGGRPTRQSTMLPQLFAIHTGPPIYRYDFSDRDGVIPDYTDGHVAVFQSRPCRDGIGGGGAAGYDPWLLHDVPHGVYRIAPYRIHTGHTGVVSAFAMEGRFGAPDFADGPVTLYSEERGPPPSAGPSRYYDDYYERDRDRDRSSIYRGHWRFSGYTVFSMYCATPIPILVFTDGGGNDAIQWPAPNGNRIAVAEGDRTIIRVWAQRWDPEFWSRTIEDAYAARAARRGVTGRAAASGGGGGGAAPAPPAAAVSSPVPKFVADLIIADAIAKGTTCPITMEPLKADKVTVTSCYHVFDTEALNSWAASQDTATTVCPQCRKSL
jgi:Ring finger domain